MGQQNKSMESFWMPFTPNRTFKKKPRLIERAQGMYYTTPEGQQILDMVAGLWCCNAGHGHPKIVEAIQAQAAKMDYAPHFGFGHSAAFEAADIRPFKESKTFASEALKQQFEIAQNLL